MLKVSRYTWDPDAGVNQLGPLFPEAPTNDDVSLRAIGRTLGRRKWLMLAIILVCLVAAAVYSKLGHKYYEAETQLLFTEQPPSAIAPQDPDASPTVETIETQVSMLTTRSMAERASQVIQDAAGKAGVALKPADTDPDVLQRSIRVDSPEKTDLITIKIEADSASKAAFLANNYAQAFIDWKRSIAQARAKVFADSLASRLGEAREKLRAAQTKLEDYQEANDVQDMDAQTKSLIEIYSTRLSDQGDLDRDAEASEQQLAEVSSLARSQVSKLRGQQWIRDDSLILDLQKQLSDAEVERAHTAIKYKEGFPGQLQPLDARINDLQARIRDMVNTSVGTDSPSLSSESDAVDQYRKALIDTTYLRAKQNANARVLAHIKTHLDHLPELQRTFANLTRDVQEDSNRVDLLQSHLASAKADAQNTQGNVQIVGEAAPPKIATRPRLEVNLVLGLLIGVFLATLAAITAESRNPSIHDYEHLRAISKLPAIDLETRGPLWTRRSDASHEVLEACAFLSVLLRDSHGNRGKVLLVSELDEGEVGENPALHTAAGFSHLGRSVLLLQCASPAAIKVVDSTPVAEVLSKPSSREPRVAYTQSLSEARTAGFTVDDLASLLDSARMIYEVIVISTCAISEGPDAILARPLCDLELVFLEYGVSKVGQFQSVQERLQAIPGGPCYVAGLGRDALRAAKPGRAKHSRATYSEEEGIL